MTSAGAATDDKLERTRALLVEASERRNSCDPGSDRYKLWSGRIDELLDNLHELNRK